jgi:CHAT domain-containing protein
LLSLQDVYNLRLNSDLVVLSACRTGLGKQIKGEGVIGLTRGFMYAGSRRVVASLWKVQDDVTAELMKEFYRNMLREGKRPAEALRLAQILLLKKNQSNSPFFWAGFVHYGEWH